MIWIHPQFVVIKSHLLHWHCEYAKKAASKSNKHQQCGRTSVPVYRKQNKKNKAAGRFILQPVPRSVPVCDPSVTEPRRRPRQNQRQPAAADQRRSDRTTHLHAANVVAPPEQHTEHEDAN